ncbi:MAG: hypothetical protein WC319_02045 [Candidatus Paceibacterota bacterium]|jgi:hypothetical protein
MAIEIVPEKKENHIIENIVLIFSVVVFLISLGSFFYFNSILTQKKAELVSLTNQLNSLTKPDMQEKVATLEEAGKYIADFKTLFQGNPNVNGFFLAFQSWTHPKVVYSGFTFDVTSRKATMVGSTVGFQNIMQQLAILKAEKTFESYEVSNINLGENGEITFNLNLVTKADVLK